MTHFKPLILPVAVFLALSQSAYANEPVPPQRGTPPAGLGMGTGPYRHGMMAHHMPGMSDAMMPEHRGYSQVVLNHANELKLTDEQIGKITRIHQGNQARIGELIKKLHETMRNTFEVFLNPASDEAAIRQSAQTHSAAFNEFMDTALKSRESVNAVLTPEQRSQLKSLK